MELNLDILVAFDVISKLHIIQMPFNRPLEPHLYGPKSANIKYQKQVLAIKVRSWG